jgi:hypothetical protein
MRQILNTIWQLSKADKNGLLFRYRYSRLFAFLTLKRGCGRHFRAWMTLADSNRQTVNMSSTRAHGTDVSGEGLENYQYSDVREYEVSSKSLAIRSAYAR